jgi:hypothetical protein
MNAPLHTVAAASCYLLAHSTMCLAFLIIPRAYPEAVAPTMLGVSVLDAHNAAISYVKCLALVAHAVARCVSQQLGAHQSTLNKLTIGIPASVIALASVLGTPVLGVAVRVLCSLHHAYVECTGAACSEVTEDLERTKRKLAELTVLLGEYCLQAAATEQHVPLAAAVTHGAPEQMIGKLLVVQDEPALALPQAEQPQLELAAAAVQRPPPIWLPGEDPDEDEEPPTLIEVETPSPYKLRRDLLPTVLLSSRADESGAEGAGEPSRDSDAGEGEQLSTGSTVDTIIDTGFYQFEIPQAQSVIGAGSFGSVSVVRGWDKSTLEEFTCAAKVVKLVNGLDWELYSAERAALSEQGHANVVGIIDWHIDEEQGVGYLFLELCSGGDLGKALSPSAGAMPEESVRELLVQLVLALQHVHACGIVHNDQAG